MFIYFEKHRLKLVPEVNQLRLLHLDALRGIAITLVLLYHAFVRWIEYFPDFSAFKNHFLLSYGWLGVELFFMISGFVISLTLHRSRNIFSFLKNRYVRLLPAMIIGIVFIFLYSFYIGFLRPSGSPSLLSIIPALLMINEENIAKILDIDIKPLEGSFWTLCVELKFYIYICVSYFYFGYRNCFILTCFLSFATSLVIFASNFIFIPEIFIKALRFLSLNYLPWFFVGMFVSKFLTSFNSVKLFTFTFAISVSFAFMLNFKNTDALVFLCMLSLIFVLPFCSQLFSSLISNKLFLFIGFISYPLYIIHENFIVAFTRFLVIKFGLSTFISMLLSIALVILIASLIAKFMEPWLSKKIKLLIS